MMNPGPRSVQRKHRPNLKNHPLQQKQKENLLDLKNIIESGEILAKKERKSNFSMQLKEAILKS